LDNEFGVGEVVERDYVKGKRQQAYSGHDLRGMKVLHDQSRIKEGQQVVVVLKDKGVLDEEEDALVNVNMIDEEKFEKNVANKQLRPELHGYNAYDEVEFDGSGALKTKSMLEKYDEEIGGVKGDGFVIGEEMTEEMKRVRIREKMQRADKTLESAEGTNLRLASDFYTQDEMVAFRKPKKKKLRKVGKKVLRADDILKLDTEVGPTPEGIINQRDLGSRSAGRQRIKSEAQDMEIDMEIDDLPPRREVDISDVKLEDDEADVDFQLALSKARKLRQKQMTAGKPKPINVAELVLKDREDEKKAAMMAGGSGSNIVLHATAEFCRTLGDIPSMNTDNLYGDEEMVDNPN
jgi:U4/U6.U5 tri-snRNP-associated protein 1